jgi:hypothetical protein
MAPSKKKATATAKVAKLPNNKKTKAAKKPAAKAIVPAQPVAMMPVDNDAPFIGPRLAVRKVGPAIAKHILSRVAKKKVLKIGTDLKVTYTYTPVKGVDKPVEGDWGYDMDATQLLQYHGTGTASATFSWVSYYNALVIAITRDRKCYVSHQTIMRMVSICILDFNFYLLFLTLVLRPQLSRPTRRTTCQQGNSLVSSWSLGTC